jgi:hypothetical protein
MYIDCPTCNYESSCFIPLGPDHDKILIDTVKHLGCSIQREGNDWEFKCPNGHKASFLPTIIKFYKKYSYPQLKNG